MSNIGDAGDISCNGNHISFLRFRLSGDRTPKEEFDLVEIATIISAHISMERLS